MELASALALESASVEPVYAEEEFGSVTESWTLELDFEAERVELEIGFEVGKEALELELELDIAVAVEFAAAALVVEAVIRVAVSKKSASKRDVPLQGGLT